MATTQNGVYAAAHFALELDNKKDVGLFRSIEGGGVRADVMTYQYNANNPVGYERWKILGKPKFEDIKLQVGMGMSQPFYEWLKDFFAGNASRKNGAIIAADFYYKERARRTFTEALIKELTFPKLDASDKNAAYMNVTLAVEDITFEKGNGNVVDVPKGWTAQKLWTACNFRFSLEGLGDACNRVTKIDSFTIKQNIIEHHVGGRKAPIKTPSPIEYPNITFYLPEADVQPFVDKMATRIGFGGKGNGTVRDPHAIHGQIDTYDNEFSSIFRLDFWGADILSITPDRSEASSEEVKMCKIEMHTEKMEFWYPRLEVV